VVVPGLSESGDYHWRSGGDNHINDPLSLSSLQDAVRRKSQSSYDIYAQECHNQIKNCTLRGLLEFRQEGIRSVLLEEVEPWTSIVKRFVTGAMS
jgi:glutamate synthase (NADPH/NADH)